MSDYIELGPNAVIREGDEYQKPGLDRPWHKVKCGYGDQVSDWPNFVWRRPRSTLIRDAAISLLRFALNNCEPCSPMSLLNDRLWGLQNAIGIPVEELRKEDE